MKLHLLRFHDGDNDTLGLLFINGKFAAFTLEDEKRNVKVVGETRIPAGTYPVKLTYSPKFTPRYGHDMLLIDNVPGFTGIRIHKGNTEKDTEGCLLVGDIAVFNASGVSQIQHSGAAYDRVYPIIAGAIRAGEAVTLTVQDAPILWLPPDVYAPI